MQLSIIVLLLCLVAVANSLAPSQLASKTPSPNVSKGQPSSKEEKPSLKPCKPIETVSSEPKGLGITPKVASITPESAKTSGTTVHKSLDDCEPIPEGIGSRLNARTLQTLVIKNNNKPSF
ncbi:uncharacterized protein LOC27209366 [Drosophila simulans]|uniref:uncharacterized protein LOC27209366 n=1 Tax=Drosophila simulans TaxID=7240 RepID=UPI00078AF25E|nr:uncharacterized protein LOC27209366 [Drosophila simulans]KMZ05211.1 uncharacterized protein Dsimw501_GD29523 [Drosophila simulans]